MIYKCNTRLKSASVLWAYVIVFDTIIGIIFIFFSCQTDSLLIFSEILWLLLTTRKQDFCKVFGFRLSAPSFEFFVQAWPNTTQVTTTIAWVCQGHTRLMSTLLGLICRAWHISVRGRLPDNAFTVIFYLSSPATFDKRCFTFSVGFNSLSLSSFIVFPSKMPFFTPLLCSLSRKAHLQRWS